MTFRDTTHNRAIESPHLGVRDYDMDTDPFESSRAESQVEYDHQSYVRTYDTGRPKRSTALAFQQESEYSERPKKSAPFAVQQGTEYPESPESRMVEPIPNYTGHLIQAAKAYRQSTLAPSRALTPLVTNLVHHPSRLDQEGRQLTGCVLGDPKQRAQDPR